MDLPLGGWLVVVFIVVWTVGGVRMLLRPPAERKLPYYAAVVLMLYGAFGFFGQALFSLVGPSWITEATELPVLWPAANIRDARGRTIVGLESAGRVQIYDEGGRFVRGWFAGNG
jgi:hypothetical protein